MAETSEREGERQAPGGAGAGPGPGQALAPLSPGHSSGMMVEAGPALRWLARWFFGAVRFDEQQVQTLRDASDAGTPVYVCNSHSLLDYLYFNFAFTRHALPLAAFANGINLTLFRPARQVFARAWIAVTRLRCLFPRRRGNPHEAFRRTLREGRPSLIFLKRSRSLIQWGEDFRLSYLRDLVEVQRENQRPLLLVPVVVDWDKKPETYRPTFMDLLLGDPQAPGRLRKLWSFAWNFRRARARAGRPVDLRRFLAANPDTTDPDVLAARLRFALSSEFLLESKAIRGPVLKGARRVVDEITRTPPFVEEVRAIAEHERLPPPVAMSRARGMLMKMAADFRFGSLERFTFVLGVLFHRLFTGVVVDEEGLNEIREAARAAPIVLIPAHRSHMDYLLYSLVLYWNGLIPPHITAGDNLSFWPMGPIFRRSGAFFIRRSGRGLPLYQAVLRHYVRKLLKEGYWVEFFIEGTRSRSGKTGSPKYGMLSMIVDAVASGAAPNAQLLPCAVTYEKVIEQKSYHSEALGREKSRESLSSLAASAKVLGSRYGKVYVEFDHPLNLRDYLAHEGVPVPLPVGESVPREVIHRLAHALVNRINYCLKVTTHHLVAFALLSHGKRGIEREALLERVGFLVTFIASRGGALADQVTDPLRGYDLALPAGTFQGIVPGAGGDPSAGEAIGWALQREVDDVLRILRKEKVVSLREFGGDWVVSVDDERRGALDYYKNGIVHFFVPEALVAAAVLRLEAAGRLDHATLGAHTRALSRVFKLEFIYGPGDEYEERFDRVVERYVAERLLVRDGESLAIAGDAREPMAFFAGVVAPFVEGYRFVGRFVAGADALPASDREIVRAALRAGRKAFSVGDIPHAESMSTVNFRNAIEWLRSEVEAGRAGDLQAAAKAMLEILG